MNLHIAENYQRLRTEVTANWKTGAVMIGVAVVVGKVYGRVAAAGVVLITVSNYQIISQQVHVISWMSLRKALIAVVVLGNNYYFTVINPQMMCNIAVALLLIDNFQLSSINNELWTQNKTLEKNNTKLFDAHKALQKLEVELQKLMKPAAELRAAQVENTAKAEVLDAEIPAIIKEIPTRLQNVNTLLNQLLSTQEMKELIAFENDLRGKVDKMLLAFKGVGDELKPITEKANVLSSSLATSLAKSEANVTITGRQIEALQNVLLAVQSYPQRREI